MTRIKMRLQKWMIFDGSTLRTKKHEILILLLDRGKRSIFNGKPKICCLNF